MPAKRFLLIYADRSRAHIETAERDSLLVAGRIRKLNNFTYEYLPIKQISKTFTNLAAIRDRFEPLAPVKRVLPGSFVFELGQIRLFEHGLETADGMAVRLQTA